MVEKTGDDIERDWKKRRKWCIGTLIFGITIFIGVIGSMDKIELPNELTGASMVFYFSIFLIVVSSLSCICFYIYKRRKINELLKVI